MDCRRDAELEEETSHVFRKPFGGRGVIDRFRLRVDTPVSLKQPAEEDGDRPRVPAINDRRYSLDARGLPLQATGLEEEPHCLRWLALVDTHRPHGRRLAGGSVLDTRDRIRERPQQAGHIAELIVYGRMEVEVPCVTETALG